MSKKHLIWKIPVGIIGALIGLILLLLLAVGCVLYVPSVRHAVLEKGLSVAREKTGMDIEMDSLYLSPFHHSPMVLYRAYKGTADLPLEVAVDSLFVGHRGQDTLLYARALRLKANVKVKGYRSEVIVDSILSIPIEVDTLRLEDATFHSDSMIAAVGIDAVVGLLDVRSPELIIAQGQYPLHGLRLYDAYVGIDLRDTPPDTTTQDTTPMRMAFDVPDGEIRNLHFALTPMDLHVRTKTLSTNVLADVGANQYDARRLNIGRLRFGLGNLSIPADTIYGNACVDLARNLIISHGLHVRSDEMGAKADLQTTQMNLETMRVKTVCNAEYQGSKASLRAMYDIDDEAYDAHVDIEKVNLAPFLKDNTTIVLAGTIDAEGKGIDPKRPMRSAVQIHMTDCIYEDFDLSGLDVNFRTDTTTALRVAVPHMKADLKSPMPVMQLVDEISAFSSQLSDSLNILALVDSLPSLALQIALTPGHPLQRYVDSTRAELNSLDVALSSDSLQKNLSIAAKARMTDGVMTFHGLRTVADLQFGLTRTADELHGEGVLKADDLVFGDMNLGSRTVNMAVSRSQAFANAIKADVQLDDIPLEIVDSIIKMADLDLNGFVRAKATADGLPAQLDLSAEVLPLNVSALYKPYDVRLSLGETPIVMEHNHVDFNGLPVYGVDSTFLALTGGLDLNSMRLDVTLAADSFAPVKLEKGGPFPVYGKLATDIRGTVKGPLDSIQADVDVTLLPVTDITYPIDKKNLAQVKPHGTVNVRYNTADTSANALQLGGQINVDEGFIRYSPKVYPIMPFHVDSGSHVAFNGSVGQTYLDVSASQKVKADVQSQGEETRRVDFRTGVRVKGVVDSVGLNAISFFLEAPKDETITRELASLDEETREGLAATLLATGMYVGESNVAQHESGYALSAIINSRINAALANSKVGKVVDIDFSSAQTEHAGGKTNDMNISISKSFFKDRFRITIGSTLTDNPEINQTSGLLSNLSAEYKLTKDGNVLLRAFADRDYNNVLEGELYKTGLGVRALKDWRRKDLYRGDSITRTHSLTTDAGVAYRSNNSIGPDLTLKYSIRNLMGKGETFTLKGNGAYYWALRNRHPGDPKKTDTYKFGANASLIFPYLHWVGDNKPEGDTRYMLGYQYENIAGGYGVHKLTGSFTYFIQSSRFITHAFTPFSLSVVIMNAESDSLLDKAAEFPQLIKVIAGNEFVPSIGYTFTYNDYRSKRAVNTLFEVGVKESGNIINALYCLAGHPWNELEKKLGSVTFNQFVKANIELRNKFNFTDQVCIATRLYAGANIPLGNSYAAPLSEAFYAGGPNNMRGASPYAYGPGNFYSEKYNQSFFHSGDVKLEANFELRFPIVWKLFGAAFFDAGNVWNWYSTKDLFEAAGITDYKEQLQLRSDLYDGLYNNPELLKQIALGTGAGLRLDLDGLVIRLDIGVAIHAPFQTYKYDKKTWQPDKSQPINTYFNIPSALDAVRFNFGIGYPF